MLRQAAPLTQAEFAVLEKSARDRLIRLTLAHPDWALGFEDEVW